MQEQHKASTDLKLALCIFITAVVALWHTLDFPMSGSYAGVENQWYVSPALFPLFLLACLCLLSLLLLFKTSKNGGFKNFTSTRSWLGDFSQQTVRDRWYTITVLAVYIYIFIPNVDFYLSTCLLCVLLASRFYLDQSQANKTKHVVGVAATVLVISNCFLSSDNWSLISLSSASDETLIFRNDLLCLAAIAAVFSLLFFKRDRKSLSATHTSLSAVVITSLIVPLIIVSVFQFALQVPMPVEYGITIQVLEWLIYDVLQMT